MRLRQTKSICVRCFRSFSKTVDIMWGEWESPLGRWFKPSGIRILCDLHHWLLNLLQNVILVRWTFVMANALNFTFYFNCVRPSRSIFTVGISRIEENKFYSIPCSKPNRKCMSPALIGEVIKEATKWNLCHYIVDSNWTLDLVHWRDSRLAQITSYLKDRPDRKLPSNILNKYR